MNSEERADLIVRSAEKLTSDERADLLERISAIRDREAATAYAHLVPAAEKAVGATMLRTRDCRSVMIRRFVALRMREDGYSIHEIAGAMGIDHSTVSHYIRMMKAAFELPSVFRNDIQLYHDFTNIANEQVREQEGRDA